MTEGNKSGRFKGDSDCSSFVGLQLKPPKSENWGFREDFFFPLWAVHHVAACTNYTYKKGGEYWRGE